MVDWHDKAQPMAWRMALFGLCYGPALYILKIDYRYYHASTDKAFDTAADCDA